MMLRAILTGAVFVALISAILAAVPQPAQAAEQRRIAGGVIQINTTGEEKTDFHIVVTSPPGEPLNCGVGLLFVDFDGPHTATILNNNTDEVTFEWLVTIPVDSTVRAAWVCFLDERNDATVTSKFTPPGSPTDVPTLGWRVNADGNVYLTNGYESAIQFSDLRFQYPVEITTDSLFDLLDTPSGTPAAVPSGTVPAASESVPGLKLIQVVDLDVGDFLTARLDTNFENPGFSNLDATEVLGHEAQVDPVGGIGEFPDVDEPSLETADSSGGSSAPLYALIAGAAAAAVVALTAGGWYARRRWLG